MKFNDKYEKGDLEFLLGSVFEYVPEGTRTTGDFAGEHYDGFWWRSCVLTPDMQQGEQGYLMVWYDGDSLRTHHTYHYPPDIFR